MEKRYCKECGKELDEDWIHDMCEKCMDDFASMIILQPDIPPNPGDFT